MRVLQSGRRRLSEAIDLELPEPARGIARIVADDERPYVLTTAGARASSRTGARDAAVPVVGRASPPPRFYERTTSQGRPMCAGRAPCTAVTS